MKSFFISLLFFTVFIVELYLGALITLSFQNLVATKWILTIQESLRKLLYLGFIIPFLLIILYWGKGSIYPWSDLNSLSKGFPQFYFSPFLFVIRNILFWTLWMVLSLRILRNKQNYGGFALVLILLTGTFWSIDWVLSLAPQFKSTAFGLIFLVSAAMAAFGFVVSFIKVRPSAQALQDINNVHFTLIGSWLYLSFVQFQIIWSGNLPEEAKWYVQRSHSSWRLIPIVVVILQCALPLFSLLVIKWKAQLNFTRFFGALTFVMQMICAYWMVIPSAHPEGLVVSVFSALAGFGILSSFLWFRRFA